MYVVVGIDHGSSTVNGLQMANNLQDAINLGFNMLKAMFWFNSRVPKTVKTTLETHWKVHYKDFTVQIIEK